MHRLHVCTTYLLQSPYETRAVLKLAEATPRRARALNWAKCMIINNSRALILSRTYIRMHISSQLRVHTHIAYTERSQSCRMYNALFYRSISLYRELIYVLYFTIVRSHI